MFGLDPAAIVTPDSRFESAAFMRAAPHPGIAKPEGRKKDDFGGFASTVDGGDPDVNVIRGLLRVLDKHVKIAASFKYTGIHQFIFGEVQCTIAILANQLIVREGCLWIFIKGFQVRVSGRRIEVKIAFLDILPVISFWPGESEEALLEDMVATVPECQSKAEAAFPVSDAQQTILPPTVSAASGLLVRKVIPRIAFCRIIFADGGPLTLGEVWTPPFPVFLPGLVFLQALKFLVHK